MAVFTKEVNLVWMLDYANYYQFDESGGCYNTRTGRQLKRTVVGYTEGYCIKSEFKSLLFLRRHLVRIKEVDCPF